MIMERFQDENKILWSFSNEILVKCPKCESKASVKQELEKCECGRCHNMVFECKNCFYKLEEPIYQYIAYGKVYCNNCFEKFEYESQPLKQEPEKYKTKCPHCKFQEELEPKIKVVFRNLQIFDGLRRDQWYNLPIWFQKDVNGNLFWAYNLEHIEYLERYIKADLRERPFTNGFNMTMVARLPQFVKAAKNREKLLKILKKWKE